MGVLLMLEKIVSAVGRFSYKYRTLISIIGIILFITVFFLQSQTMIEYTYAEESIVTDIFPQDDTVLLVYDNYDEKSIEELISYLEKDEHVKSIQAYSNTLGIRLSPAELSEMLGIDVVFLNTLFYIYENGMLASGMTFTEFVTFLSSDSFLNNEMFSSMIDEDSKAQIQQLGVLVDALNNGKKYSANDISKMFGVDANMVKIIFYIKQLINITPENALGTILGTTTGVLGMDTKWVEDIFDTQPIEKMTLDEFVSTLSTIYPVAQNLIEPELAAQFESLLSIADSVKNNTVLYPEDIAAMFSSMDSGGMLNDDTVTLLYIMSKSNALDYSDKRIALYDFFMFISENIVSNESLSSFFDADVAEQIESAKVQMLDGKSQLVGSDHSRMVITIDYVPESKEIRAFYDSLTNTLDSLMVKDYYLVGNSAMSYEVAQTFDKEFLIINLVTAIVIFLVVLFTFKNFPLSILLICVIECAVFAMMSVMTVAGSPIFFIALILVQCILMGTMIDYAILFTTYYMETRKTFCLEEALPEVMRRSAYAILTSSLILILVTFICGLFMTGTVAAILQTLSIGALCAILLILFVLPSLLVILDKWIIKDSKEIREAIDN